MELSDDELIKDQDCVSRICTNCSSSQRHLADASFEEVTPTVLALEELYLIDCLIRRLMLNLCIDQLLDTLPLLRFRGSNYRRAVSRLHELYIDRPYNQWTRRRRCKYTVISTVTKLIRHGQWHQLKTLQPNLSTKWRREQPQSQRSRSTTSKRQSAKNSEQRTVSNEQ